MVVKRNIQWEFWFKGGLGHILQLNVSFIPRLIKLDMAHKPAKGIKGSVGSEGDCRWFLLVQEQSLSLIPWENTYRFDI